MQPPPLAATKHGKLSFHVCFTFSRPRPNTNLFSRYAAYLDPSVLIRSRTSPSALAVGRCVSLLFEANETPMPRLRNFDTEPPSSYRYELDPPNPLQICPHPH